MYYMRGFDFSPDNFLEPHRDNYYAKGLYLSGNFSMTGKGGKVTPRDAKGMFMLVFWGILIPLISLPGLVGNTLTIIVLRKKEMLSTAALYLTWLAITDNGLLLSILILPCPYSWYLNFPEHNDFYMNIIFPYTNLYVAYLGTSISQMNVLIIMCAGIERYIAICHPFRASSLVTRESTIRIIIGVAVFSFLISVPILFAKETIPKPCIMENETITAIDVAADNNVTAHENATSGGFAVPTTSSSCSNGIIIKPTDFGESDGYLFYQDFISPVVIFVIPLFVLVFVTVFLIKELRGMQKRRGSSNKNDDEANLTLVLVLIIVVFLVCQLPVVVDESDMVPQKISSYVSVISTFMLCLNSSVNFLIYTAFGKRFRYTLLNVYRSASMTAAKISEKGSQFFPMSPKSRPSTENKPSFSGDVDIKGRPSISITKMSKTGLENINDINSSSPVTETPVTESSVH